MLMTWLFLTACHGQQTNSVLNAANRASEEGKANVTAASSQSAYKLIDGLIKDPRIVEQPWLVMQRAFPDGCQQALNSTEVICPALAGVIRISAMASGHGIVEVGMTSPVTCDELRAVVIRRFGPAQTTSVNGCSGDWDLSQYMKSGYLRISKGKKDPSKVSLQFGVEQGP